MQENPTGEAQTASLVFAADEAFVVPLAVTIASVAAHTGSRRQRAFVLHAGLVANLRARVEDAAGSSLEVEWIDAGSGGATTPLPNPTYASEAVLFRLRAADLLPSDVTRAIYLDADTLVRESLDPLWTTPLDDALLGAVRDASGPWTGLNLDWRSLAVDPASAYFNSGVMVLPLERWRAEEIGTRAVGLLERARLRYPDQDSLNLLVGPSWCRLHPRWNLQSAHLAGDNALARVSEPVDELEAALNDPAIVHLSSGAWRRPWEPCSTHPFRDEWLAMLDTTPWSGWRPREPNRLVAARRRASTALRLLVKGR